MTHVLSQARSQPRFVGHITLQHAHQQNGGDCIYWVSVSEPIVIKWTHCVYTQIPFCVCPLLNLVCVCVDYEYIKWVLVILVVVCIHTKIGGRLANAMFTFSRVDVFIWVNQWLAYYRYLEFLVWISWVLCLWNSAIEQPFDWKIYDTQIDKHWPFCRLFSSVSTEDLHVFSIACFILLIF